MPHPVPLRIPANKSSINECSPLTLMRLRVRGKPVVGWIVNGAPRPSMVRYLVWIDSDGNLNQGIASSTAIEFIDYLTQDDSVTIFGDAAERTEDDIAPSELEIDLSNIENIPDNVPFLVNFITTGTDTYKSIIVTSKNMRRCMLLIVVNHSFKPIEAHGYQPIDQTRINKNGWSWKAVSLLPIEDLILFADHKCAGTAESL